LSVLPALAGATAAPSLEFIQNKGQWAAPVRYAAPLRAGRLFLQSTGLTYSFVDPEALHHHEATKNKTVPAGPRIAAHAYTVHFEKANAQPRITAEAPTTEVRNYFIGKDESRWASNVASFRRLHYAGVWPGIDLHLYENAGQRLEYDFLLAPRANPARIALRYEGAEALTLDATGNLVVKTSVNTVTELAPTAWQTGTSGERQPVVCQYVLTGSTVSFRLGAYDKRRPLTIDPVVVFSTYSGSLADNWGFTATYDQQGNMYSGGIAFDQGFPASLGAFSTRFADACDIALIKYNTQVSGPAARVWATYLGGSSGDFPHSMVTNAQGELFLLGSTSSSDYPTTSGALARTFRGGPYLDPFDDGGEPYDMPNGADMVVTRLGAAGNILRASTFLGGSGNDGVQNATATLAKNYGDSFRSDILLDGADNVFVAASTTSTNFPGAPSSGPAGHHGGTDGILCKLTPALNAVSWAAYVGGSGADALYSLQLDSQGRVYACGGTTSPNLPTTTGAYRPSRPGGLDGFVIRYNAAGTALEAATYTGTPGYDQAYLLQLDAGGNPYLFGQTLGNFPHTAGLFGNATGTLFIQKLNANLTASLYSTSFGDNNGGPSLVPTAFLVDDCERVYVSGWGGNVNNQKPYNLGGFTYGLPVTNDAMEPNTDGSDFYLAEFTPGLMSLEYATFFGESGGVGEHVDGGTSRFDKRGIVYQAVCASCGGSQGFPTPSGAGFYTTRNGSASCNNAAFKIDFQPVVADPGPRRSVCLEGGPVPLGGSPAGGTWSGPGIQAAPGGGYQFSPTAVGPGTYMLAYTVQTTGICQSTLRVRYVVPPVATMAFPVVPGQCLSGQATTLTASPPGGIFSGPGVSGTHFAPQTAGVGTHLLTYTVCDSITGSGTISQSVVVSAVPPVAAGRDTTLCADLILPFQLRGQFPSGGTWSGPGVTPNGYFTPPNTNNRGGVFPLTYTITQPPCTSSAVRTVVLAPASTVDVSLNLPVCATAPQYGGLAPFDCPLTPVLLAPNASYRWDFGDGSPTSTEATPTHRYEREGTYRISLTARYDSCEVITQFAPLEVGKVFVPNIITANGDGKNDTFGPRFSCQPASLKVFSRWGQEVYHTDAYANDWRAEGLSPGIYYYLLRDTTGRSLKGWVEVVK
jgi:hypothetical protein